MLIELENPFENEGERLLIDQSFDFSGEELNGVRPFVSPVKVKGEVRNRAGIVSLHARAAFVFSAPCDRCAAETRRDMLVPLEHVLVTHLDEEDTGEFIVVEGMRLDLTALVREDLLLALPAKFLCREDCKGLCPICGKNLNDGSCSCKKPIDPRLEALRQLFKENPGIKGIIHFAASKAVGESVQKPLLYYRNNLMSLVNLLTLMPEYGVEGIVFSSSCTVYGQPDVLPVDESAPIKPALSPNGNTKQICEEIIKDTIHASAPFKSIILRYFNPIGAHPTAEIGELPNGVPQNLIPYLTQTAIGIRKELSVFGDDYHTPDGSCIRDYINVVDLAKAHVTAMNRMLENKSPEAIEIFNLGTGRGVSVLELISAFEKATGVKVPHKIVGRREGDIEQVWANPERANKVLGWTAQESIEDTLASAWKWQLKLRERGIM